MRRLLEHSSLLFALEWRRRRAWVGGGTATALVLWTTALASLPDLRDGSASGSILALACGLFTAFLAGDTFARDAGEGRLEFLHANGASPIALFLGRVAALSLGSVIFGCVLQGAEWFRLLTYHGVARRGGAPWLPPVLGADSREILVLYALPATALALLLSSVTSRTLSALGLAGALALAVSLLDHSVAREAGARERLSLASAFWALAVVPACAGLAALGLWLRRFEPSRPSVRIGLLAAAAVLIAARHLSLSAASRPGSEECWVVRSAALSPDAKRFAIDGFQSWQPTRGYRLAAQAIGQGELAETIPVSSAVVVAGSGGRIQGVPVRGAAMESSALTLPWLTAKCLRLRGESRTGDLAGPAPLLFDFESGRVLDAPSITRESGDAKSQRTWVFSWDWRRRRATASERTPAGNVGILDADGDGVVELCRLASGARVHLLAGGDVRLVEGDGTQRKIWPPPPDATPR